MEYNNNAYSNSERIIFCALEPSNKGHLKIGDRTYAPTWPLGRTAYHESLELINLGIAHGKESFKRTNFYPENVTITRKGNLTKIIVFNCVLD